MKRIYAIIGPSGSGKTTLGQYLKEIGIPELISTTTRQKRIGEIDGVHYHFVTLEQIDKMELVEHVIYSGNHYGLSKKEVDSKLEVNDKVYAVVDIEGIKALKEMYGDIVKVIFIYCSPEQLFERMIGRGDTVEQADKRLQYMIDTKELDRMDVADFVILTHKFDEQTCRQLLSLYVLDFFPHMKEKVE